MDELEAIVRELAADGPMTGMDGYELPFCNVCGQYPSRDQVHADDCLKVRAIAWVAAHPKS